MKKNHKNRGETFIEVLGAILIAGLSVALMFACIMWSTHEDINVKELDEQHYGNLTAADAQEHAPTPMPSPGATPVPTPAPVPGTVTVTGEAGAATEIPVTIYGDGGMSSYRRE